MLRTLVGISALLVACCLVWAEENRSGFFYNYWFEKGIENGNPLYTNRLRVNAPEAVTGNFHNRPEVRSNGMVQILMEQDIVTIRHAELYCEMWGGHPGTANKRVSINGRSTYPIDDQTEEHHCSYHYPVIPIKITDLVDGFNAIQFACDQGDTFWGHYLLDNVALNVYPRNIEQPWKIVNYSVKANVAGNEKIDLHLNSTFTKAVKAVHYQGFYSGYDENGDGVFTDWHGFTKNRKPHFWIGSATEPPYHIQWDTSMLPAQDYVRVRALIEFVDEPLLYYRTEPSQVFSINKPTGIEVELIKIEDLPKPFWSRDNNPKEATIQIDQAIKPIQKTQLHIVIWDGGSGDTKHPVTLNGHPLNVAGEGNHDVLYKILDVPTEILKQGENVFRLLSSTHHHGIEVLYPGPALMIRNQE